MLASYELLNLPCSLATGNSADCLDTHPLHLAAFLFSRPDQEIYFKLGAADARRIPSET